mmetsp:Transcript_32323/g.72952  ORF Transcript_32323/g.72952 Transcript_32323/m.72952 type:complete len:148 (+) Transcript_32323:118-561(+)
MSTTFISSSAPLGALVIDCGSVTTKAGFAGDDQPSSCFSSTMVTWDEPDGTMKSTADLHCLGAERLSIEGKLQIQRLGAVRSEEREALVTDLCRHAIRTLGAIAEVFVWNGVPLGCLSLIVRACSAPACFVPTCFTPRNASSPRFDC